MSVYKTFENYLNEARKVVEEIFPWDLNDYLAAGNKPVLIDVREPAEVLGMRMEGTKHIPRGVLEQSVSEGYQETVPELTHAQKKEIIIVCRSGNRSLLAAKVLKEMGFQNVKSMKTGLKGWADYGLPLYKENGEIATYEESERFFYPNG